MPIDLVKIRQKLAPEPQINGEPGLRLRTGTVNAVNTNGTVDLVIAAEMARLSAVSTSLDCKSFADLYQRLLGVEVAATMAAIQHLAVRGDTVQALLQLNTDLNIPNSLKGFGIQASDIDGLVEGASKVTRLLDNNPRPMARDDMRAIYSALL